MSAQSETDQPNAFESAARTAAPSFLAEMLAFLKREKKWWLVPILVALAGLALVIVLGGTSAAPFIYTLF